MGTDSLNITSAPQIVSENGNRNELEPIKENIKSSIKNYFGKHIGPLVSELLDTVSISSTQCKQMIFDVEEMEKKLVDCEKLISVTKARVPDQVCWCNGFTLSQVAPVAKTVEEKGILEASKEQKLPPHLVNRLMARKSLSNSRILQANRPRSSIIKNSPDPFSVEPPPLPLYIQPDIAIQINGSIVIVPIQPPIRLSASAVDGGISIKGELDEPLPAAGFQPALSYDLFSYSPSGNDALRIQLGIAWTKIAVITASQLPFTFVAVNLPPNNVHFFVLRGVDVLGRIGPWSNIVRAITG
ncbi:hypothetical protein Aperf_G00000118507 [Anoplocephala perfoliata]